MGSTRERRDSRKGDEEQERRSSLQVQIAITTTGLFAAFPASPRKTPFLRIIRILCHDVKERDSLTLTTTATISCINYYYYYFSDRKTDVMQKERRERERAGHASKVVGRQLLV